MLTKAVIKDGVVVNIFVVDPENIPDWATVYPDIPEPFGIGSYYDGASFYNPPTEGPTA